MRENFNGFFDGVEGGVVFFDDLVESFVFLFSQIGLVLDVLVGSFNGFLEVGDVHGQGVSLDVQNVLQKFGGVGNVGVGLTDLSVDSGDFSIVFVASSVIFVVGSFDFSFQVGDYFFDGIYQLV